MRSVNWDSRPGPEKARGKVGMQSTRNPHVISEMAQSDRTAPSYSESVDRVYFIEASSRHAADIHALMWWIHDVSRVGVDPRVR